MSNRHRATFVVAAVGMALVATVPDGLGAQTVLGRVLERGGGGAVAGAMVRLLSGGSATGAAWLTGADGRFRLQAPAGGSYQIEVERIGFTTTLVGGATVAGDGIAVMDVVVEPQPVELQGLEVSAKGGRCEADGAGAGVAQIVWDEARKALSAASWTQARGGLRFLVSVWDREVSPRTSQILNEETSQRETIGANSVQSLPPERLLAEGYVHSNPAYTYYYAPDAEALLSDEFQSSHCFRVVEAGGNAPYLGLEFEPDRERELPDVAGTIWVDRVSGRLDRVEFRYTGLDVAGAALAKGEVGFAELANGQWIVREWFIQAPMGPGAGRTTGLMGRSDLQIHEVGNAVQLVEGQGLLWRPDIAPGVVRGTVFDSIAGRPLAGAVVRVGARNLRAIANLDGRFELKGVTPGVHRVTFDHPRLDSLGVTPGWQTVAMEPGAVAGLELAVPPWTTLLARSCASGASGTLVGTVYSRSGSPVAEARVELVSARTEAGGPIATLSDAQGGYALCEVEPGVAQVSASLGGAESTPVEVRVDTAGFARADLTLLPGVAAVDGRLPVLERVGYYQRALTHPGAFIQRDDIAAVSPTRTSDLLGRVPGVRVTTETSAGLIRRRVLFNRLALLEGELCYPALFVDGELVRIGGSRTESQWPATQGVEPPAREEVPSIDELVPPHEVIAVELYENAARLPGRFIGLGTRCGVIAIWTIRAR
ncbi:MAG TPA: carboxypeptidase regulatory-like domain-containing protein [Longimicrobiales bacterium]|nr:carboxypeptidase regulatory-like domain-containing protein [Longimicrobiales bacterium]